MQNLLIVENNLNKSIFLLNSISEKIQEIRIYNIVSTALEAINIIKKEKVDIILIDLSSLVEDGIKLINYIKKNNIEKYNSSIIIITDDVKILKKINENKFIFNYCLKFNDIDIINNLNNLVNENQERIPIKLVKNKIKIELEKLCFNFSYLGTKYLYECIYQCYYQKDYYNINLSKDIYPIISKRYNKSINSIKINIFQASYIMYCSNDKISLSKYFGYRIIEKPKTKDIIFIVLQKIKETIS